jgi:hypothetical protein
MHRLLAALILLCSSTAYSQTVYKTEDENGVVSFSDTPPQQGIKSEVLQLQVTEPQSPEDYQASLDAMRESTDRMAEDRMAREKHRAEMKELQAKTRSYQTPATAGYYDPDYYYSSSSSRRYQYRPPLRPGHRPKPEHPIVRPPLRPGHYGYSDPNSQLMRPLVSGGSNNSQLMRPIVSGRR